MIITLPANQKRVEEAKAGYTKITSGSLVDRAAARNQEFASGDGDFQRIKTAEGRFIDLAIHKDTFLDDFAITTDLQVTDIPVWKSRYEPVVGIVTGSVYGGPTSTLYTTKDNYATLQPFVIDVEDVRVPKLALTMDPDKLGQRSAALERQAEALKIKLETFVLNVAMGQPLGQDLATTVINYFAAGNSYTGKTVYVADPGVQSGTYETTNLIDVHTEGGLTPTVAEALSVQDQLTGRIARTIHFAKQGLPARKLYRYATVVADQGTGSTNPSLRSIPASAWEDVWNGNFVNGVVLNWFGATMKFKSNNALPQGYAVVTTDQPGAEVFNILAMATQGEYNADPRDQFFSTHWLKRQMAICTPDPWLRNFYVLNYGNTSL
jgi:hypothetical protein